MTFNKSDSEVWFIIITFNLLNYVRFSREVFFFFFAREFQPMTSASDDSFLLSDQDTNQFFV